VKLNIYDQITDIDGIDFLIPCESSSRTLYKDSLYRRTGKENNWQPQLRLEKRLLVQEKYKIAAKIPGSGNTTNIGSISSNNIDDFKDGKSGFSSKSEFDKYWRAYKK
jgi:hypothetical protein